LVLLLLFLRCLLANVETLHCTAVLYEAHLEEHVRVREQAFLQTHDDELARLEVLPDHEANVLSMRQVQSRVDLIEDVEWRRMVLEQGKDQAKGQKGTLAATELTERLLLRSTEHDLELESLVQVVGVDRVETRAGTDQQRGEDVAAVLVNFLPGLDDLLVLQIVKLQDRVLKLLLVEARKLLLLLQILILRLGLLEHGVHLQVDALFQLLVLCNESLKLRANVVQLELLEVIAMPRHTKELLLCVNPLVIRAKLGNALRRDNLLTLEFLLAGLDLFEVKQDLLKLSNQCFLLSLEVLGLLSRHAFLLELAL